MGVNLDNGAYVFSPDCTIATAEIFLSTEYRYTGNETFLRQNYDVMKQVAIFYIDFMDEYNGWRVTNPSLSPENEYYLPNSTTIAEAVTLGPT